MKDNWPIITAVILIVAMAIGGLGYYRYQHRDDITKASTTIETETSTPNVPIENSAPSGDIESSDRSESSDDADCNSNYEPCVPDSAYDLDCSDIGTSVTVTGTDEYGLDRDGDGVGCESY